MITLVLVKLASADDLRDLSRILLAFVRDKEGQFYQDNIAKFGIPEEYGEKVFSENSLLKAVRENQTTFYLATDRDEILGFAQVIPADHDAVELDRIVVFPEHARKGIGTLLLQEAIADHKRKSVRSIFVRTGKDEAPARRFYEKNGFREIKQATIDTPWGTKLDLVIYERLL